jgi:hypothetical protein
MRRPEVAREDAGWIRGALMTQGRGVRARGEWGGVGGDRLVYIY